MATDKPSIYQPQSDSKHLAEEHGLVRTTAFVRKPANARSPGAERVARCRARKRAAGIISIEVRSDLAEVIKSVGAADDLIQLIRASKSPAVQEERRLAEVGKRIERLPDLFRWLLLKL